MKHAGGTFSAHKLYLGVPEVNIVSHTCNYEGQIPDQTQVSKIQCWPACRDVTEVQGFLGTCGVVRIFIEKFGEISQPLVQLTKRHRVCVGRGTAEGNGLFEAAYCQRTCTGTD